MKYDDLPVSRIYGEFASTVDVEKKDQNNVQITTYSIYDTEGLKELILDLIELYKSMR